MLRLTILRPAQGAACLALGVVLGLSLSLGALLV